MWILFLNWNYAKHWQIGSCNFIYVQKMKQKVNIELRMMEWKRTSESEIDFIASQMTIKIYEAKKTRSDAISHHHHNHQMTHDIYMSHGMWSHPYAIHLVHFLANKFSNQINLLLSYSNRCCGICDISKKTPKHQKKRVTGADVWFQNAGE